ncbi:DUF2975 domain-containing protein [Ideonella sp. DXS22W]|uniref:DUF2975 domain-containing protein n=1 Tax=Pseudaquabacterium inlustre TaxID=2984192 RepID=A0ABU9CB21_9BURK
MKLNPVVTPVFPTDALRWRVGTVRALVLLGAVAAPLLTLVLWTSDDWLRAVAPQLTGLAADTRFTIDDRARAWGAAASLPVLALVLWTLWRLWQLFGEYARGQVFSRAALGHLRGFARGLLALGLAGPLLRTAVALALTVGNPPGQKLLVLSIDLSDYAQMLVGAVLLTIAAVMDHAAALAEDNAGFV